MIETKLKKISIKKIKIDHNLELKEMNFEYYEKIKTQIDQNGQLLPILVNQISDDEYIVLDGKIRFKIFQELEYEEIICSVIKVSDAKAKILTLQFLEDFDFNVLQVAKLINSVSKESNIDILPNTMNFLEKQIKMYTDIYNWDWSIFDADSVPLEFRHKIKLKTKKMF